MSPYQEICNLKARYCRAADDSCEDREASLKRLQALFTADVVADYGFGEIAGGEDVARFLTDSIAGGSEWMVHNIHSPLVEVDGEEARGEWTVNVRMQRPESDAADFVFGRYADSFRREEGVWKIARVTFRRYE